MIRLRLLGPVAIDADDGRDPSGILRQPKRAALLAYLASDQARPFARRDAILAAFWPDLDTARARDALSSALVFLRRHLGEGVVRSQGDDVGLVAGAVVTDVSELEVALAAGRPGDALALYRGPLLDGFHADATGFEEWLARERERVRDLAVAAARGALADAVAAGDAARALAVLRKWAAIAPDDGRAVTGLVEVLHAAGDPAAALRAYEAYAGRLAAEFGLAPSGDLEAAVARVRRGEAPRFALPAGPPVPRNGAAEADAPVAAPSGGRRRHASHLRPALFVGTALGVGIFAVAGSWTHRQLAEPLVTQLSFAGVVRAPVLSPDSRFLAYIRNDCDSLRRCRDVLFVQDTGGISERAVAEGVALTRVVWSADGRYLVFGDEVVRSFPEWRSVPANGGRSPKVLGCCVAGRGGGGDTVVLLDARGMPQVLRFITLGDGIVRDTVVLPRRPLPALATLDVHGPLVLLGRMLLDREGRVLDSVAASAEGLCSPRRLQWPATASAVYYPACIPQMPGYFSIVRLEVDRAGRFRPPADTVARNLPLGLLNPFFHVSDDERLLTYTVNRPNVAYALERPRAGSVNFRARPLAAFGSRIHGQVSPDGRRVAVGRLVDPEARRWEYSLMPFDSGPESPLGVMEDVVVGGVTWAADGSALIEASRPGGDTVVIARRDLATWERHPITQVRAVAGALYAVPGGGAVLHVRDARGDGFLRLGVPGLRDATLAFPEVPAGGVSRGGSPFTGATAAVSPDGREIVSFAAVGDSVVLERMSLVTGTRRRLRAWPRFAAWRPLWLPDGAIEFGPPTSWYVLSPGETTPRLLGALPWPVANYNFSADGLRAVANVASVGGDAFLIRNFGTLIGR